MSAEQFKWFYTNQRRTRILYMKWINNFLFKFYLQGDVFSNLLLIWGFITYCYREAQIRILKWGIFRGMYIFIIIYLSVYLMKCNPTVTTGYDISFNNFPQSTSYVLPSAFFNYRRLCPCGQLCIWDYRRRELSQMWLLNINEFATIFREWWDI